MKVEKTHIAAVFLSVFAVAGFVSAAPTYYFNNISGNNALNAAAGESQLSMDLVDLGSGSVEFLFRNSGPAASSITDIYFDTGDSGSLFGSISFLDSVGTVSFSPGAAPRNLPGGNPFGFSADFAADSDAPTQPKGVNPGEQIGLSLSGDYGTVVNELATGSLRVGLHVQGFANGGSESFISSPPSPPSPPPSTVPAPGSIFLGGIGIGIVGLLRKRKNMQPE